MPKKGNVAEPAQSGYLLPASHVTVTTDLDQVLDVLTPNVRTRLAILINAAGRAFTGRRADFSETLKQLPADLQAGNQLLGGISADNHTLADLVQTTEEDLMNIRNFGRKSLLEVRDKLAQFGLTLAGAPLAEPVEGEDEEEGEE